MAQRLKFKTLEHVAKSGKVVSQPLLNSVPKGWKEVKGALTAPKGYTWISNGKSLFGGERQSALVKTSTFQRQARGGSAG